MRTPRVIALLLACAPAFALPAALNLKLPSGAKPTAIEIGAQGDVYLAGSIWSSGLNSAILDSFVARYDPSADRLVYVTQFVGRASFTQNSLALDAAGDAYVAGYAYAGFPTTIPSAAPGALVAKIGPDGQIAYSTILVGPSPADSFTTGNGIAVNKEGEAYVTGRFAKNAFGVNWPATAGAAVNLDNQTNQGFVAKLDATGTHILLLERGIGGSLVVLDPQENIYAVGAFDDQANPPVTPNAYQHTVQLSFCGGFEIPISCTNQHVAKLDPTGGTLLYATYISGTYGAQANSIAVDAQGRVYLAGSTASPDYPVTAGAVDGTFRITSDYPQPLNEPLSIVPPPLETGFVTELSADGSSLVFSTFLGGSLEDSVTTIRLVQNQIYVSGFARSPEFPGLGNVDARCRPNSFVMRIAGDGTSVDQAHGIPLVAAKNFAIDARSSNLPDFISAVAIDAAGLAYQVGPTETVYRFDPAVPDPLACITDSATFQTTDTTAPGELLSVLGTWSATSDAAADTTLGLLPTALANIAVDFDGIAGHLLYASPGQINVMVPYEIAGRSSTTMNVRNQSTGALQVSQSLAVVPRRPSVFTYELLPGGCTPSSYDDDLPLARNADGTFNSCTNPASGGSIVRLYLNGGGVPANGGDSGRISSDATPVGVPVYVAVSATFSGVEVSSSAVENFSLETGSVSGVWRLDFKLPTLDVGGGAILLGVSVDGVPLQNRVLEIVAKP